MALTEKQKQLLQELHAKRTDPIATSTPIVEQAATSEPEPKKANPVANFISGAFDAFAAPGRAVQSLLPKSLATVPQPGGARTGDEVGRELRLKMTGADPDSFATKAGEFAGEVANFAIPGSMAAKATAKAPLIAKMAAQGATSFGVETARQGEVTPSSFAAGAVDAAFPMAGKALDVGKTMLKGITGGLTGTGVDVIEAALERPGAAWKAAGKDVTQGIKELSTSIRTGVTGLHKKAGQEYAELVSQAGVKELPGDDIINGVTNRIAELADGTITKEGLDLADTPLSDAEERLLTKVYNNVQKWTDWTPEGVNTLARKISRFRRGAADSANYDRIVDTVKRELREYVGKVAPTIKEANERFADKMDLLDEIDNVLKTDTKFAGREGVRKTAEALGRIFNSGKEFTREAIEDLEKELGIDIIGTLAGQQLTENVARSTTRLAGPVEASINAVAGPVARNLVPLAGAIQKQLVDRLATIPGVPPTARAAIVNALAEFFREEE